MHGRERHESICPNLIWHFLTISGHFKHQIPFLVLFSTYCDILLFINILNFLILLVLNWCLYFADVYEQLKFNLYQDDAVTGLWAFLQNYRRLLYGKRVTLSPEWPASLGYSMHLHGTIFYSACAVKHSPCQLNEIFFTKWFTWKILNFSGNIILGNVCVVLWRAFSTVEGVKYCRRC